MLKTLAALVVAGTFVSVDAFTATPSLARVGITARTSALADHKHKLSLRRWLSISRETEEKRREDFSHETKKAARGFFASFLRLYRMRFS
jgi:hypothetical protein